MFRFTIRDVLWLTVVIGLIVGWSIHAAQSSARRNEFQNLRSKYQYVVDVARKFHGWDIQEEGDAGISIVWPRTPPPSSRQVMTHAIASPSTVEPSP